MLKCPYCLENSIETKVVFNGAILKLSEREKEILLQKIKGLTQPQIAIKIGISQGQISRLLGKIKNKIAV